MPYHESMWAGFPCQPFSPPGRNEGLMDRSGRGIISLHMLRLVEANMPNHIVIEDVGAMADARHAEFFETVLGLLRDIVVRGLRYHVEWRTMNTVCCGIPQSRPRCWIVAVRSDVLVNPLQWPQPQEPCETMDVLLGPRPPLDVVLDGAKVLTSSSSRNSLARAYVELACRVSLPIPRNLWCGHRQQQRPRHHE